MATVDKEALKAELIKQFKGADANNDGFVDRDELLTAITTYFPDLSEDMVPQTRDLVLSECDTNNDGKIDLNEFLSFLTKGLAEGPEGDDEVPEDEEGNEHTDMMSSIMQNLSHSEIDMLRDAFIHMDMDSDGLVSLEEMFHVVRSVVGDEKFGPLAEYLEPMYVVADKDQDGKLSLTEFLASFADGPGVVPQDVINACVSSVRVRLTDEEIQGLQERFRDIDKNNDGFIDPEELLAALKNVLLAKHPHLTEDGFEDIVTLVMNAADADHDGKLSLAEFIRSFQEDQGVLPAAFIDVRAQHVARQLTPEEVAMLKETFAALDSNNDGFVDYKEMYQALWDALQNSVQEKGQIRDLCNIIMATADRNKDGKLNLTDFIRNFVNNTDIMSVPVAAVQERLQAARVRLDELLDAGNLERMFAAFRQLDTNNDGFLEREELEGILTSLVQSELGDVDQATMDQIIDILIAAADTDSDGRLSLAEFVQSFVNSNGILPQEVVDEIAAEEVEAEEAAAAAEGEAEGAEEQQEQQEQEQEQQEQQEQEQEQPLGQSEAVEGKAAAEEEQVPEAQEATADAPQAQTGALVAQTTPQRRSAGDDDDARSPITNDVSGCAISDGQLRREFNRYDKDGNGFLDRNEFKNVYISLQNFGLDPTPADVDRLFSKYGTADDKISYDEFCILMLQRSRM